MSRTDHHLFSTPDPWRVGHRLERQARPAGRIEAIVEAELAAEGGGAEPWDLCYVPAEEDTWEDDMFDGYTARHNTPCGGYCRRCLLHDDPGGCIVSEQLWVLFHLMHGVPAPF